MTDEIYEVDHATGGDTAGAIRDELHPDDDRPAGESVITDDLEALLVALPPQILGRLQAMNNRANLLEVVMDLGRRPEARFHGNEAYLSEQEVTHEDIDYVVQRIGNFGEDNRAGIERTLHRISCIRNRSGRVIGLTCRIGRAVYGTINIIRDLVETGKSILLLGPPGVGKTTLLREVARVLSDEFGKRVVIVDTSNEIAGDGDIPHPSIGRARRMQVPSPSVQHAVMIEAVENHMPEVIVIDEIGTELEAMAARTIAERGVQLVGTAHGTALENLMLNPTLSDLIGGIQTVTLGDEEARRRGTQKSVLERKAPPTFDMMVEILDRDRVAVHLDVAEVVDSILRGMPIPPEIRERRADGRIITREGHFTPSRDGNGNGGSHGGGGGRDGGPRGRRDDRREDRRGGGGRAASGAGNGVGAGFERITGSGGNRSPMGTLMSMQSMSPGPRRATSAVAPLPAGQEYYSERAARRLPPTAGRYATPVWDEDAEEGEPEVEAAPARTAPTPMLGRKPGTPGSSTKPLRIYPFGVSRARLEQAVGLLGVPVSLARDTGDADIVLTLKNYYKKKPPALRAAEGEGLPVYVLKSNTASQMQQILASIFELPPTGLAGGAANGAAADSDEDPLTAALVETEEAITHVLESAEAVELPPANAYIRRLQHQMAERYNLGSQSRGREPNRRVRIYRQEA
jgi:stage III sporulation protein SpoIIIAA